MIGTARSQTATILLSAILRSRADEYGSTRERLAANTDDVYA